jgi:transcriptional regulator with XRE-family HTH domain
MTDGEKVKHIRSLLNLTQTEFAEKLSIRQQNIAKIESGAINGVSFLLLQQLVKVFNVNPYFFIFNNKSEPEFSTSNSNTELRKKIKKYEDAVDKLMYIRRQ